MSAVVNSLLLTSQRHHKQCSNLIKSTRSGAALSSKINLKCCQKRQQYANVEAVGM